MNRRTIWPTAAVLAVIALLAQAAGASTRDGTAPLATSAAGTTAITTEVTETKATLSVPTQAASVGREESANGIATSNEAITDRAQTTASNEATEASEATDTTETDEATMNTPAAAPKDSTTGARPGWGCQDVNHKHSGPPGRPGATPPPGCARH